jgi:pimeloyl-ACP methyl ester carboxylesterase
VLGASERMDLFEYDDKHSISKPFREAGLRWMRRWLLHVDDAPVETDFPIEKPEDLQCTKSGHVLLDFPEKTTYAFTAEVAERLASERKRLGGEELRRDVLRRIAVDASVPAAILRPEKSFRRDGLEIRRVVFETEPGLPLPGLVFVPETKKAALPLLYVHGAGKAKEALAGGAIERWVRAGYEVTAVDLRGMGELEPDPPHKGLSHWVTPEWKEAYMAFNMGRPLLGQRVRDLRAVAAAIDVDGKGLHVVGVGTAAPIALHAALLDPRIRELTLEGMVVSWTEVAKTAVTINQLSNVAPGALKVYDLPDLAAALAPRPLTVRSPKDAVGEPIAPAAFEEAWRAVRSAYAELGAEAALVLEKPESR